mmetsp:Transcript_15064/g.22775  ORF Transcript_15064/g.22775 Transcript_15064/m.22775 type:complete len:449 (+) Transcript_15064:68-1414(+)
MAEKQLKMELLNEDEEDELKHQYGAIDASAASPVDHESAQRKVQTFGRVTSVSIDVSHAKEQAPKLPLYLDGKVKMVSDVDVVEETFSIRFHLHITMPITQEQWEEAKQDEEKKLKLLPSLNISNLVEGDDPVILCKGVKKIGDRYKVQAPYSHIFESHEYLARFKIDFACQLFEPMELEKFPFDCQDLTIPLQCDDPRYELTRIMFQDTKGGTSSWFSIDRENLCLKDFDLSTKCLVEFRNQDPSKSKGGNVYSIFTVRLKLYRRFPFYFWNFYLVNGLLSASAITCFTFDCDQDGIGNRFAVLFTILLTLMAAKFTISDQVPKLSYNTALDIYIIGNFVFVILLTMCSSFFPLVLDKHDPDDNCESNEAAGAYDSVLFWGSIITWFVAHGVYCIYAIHSHRIERRKLKGNMHDLKAMGMEPQKPLKFLASVAAEQKQGLSTFRVHQ